MLLRDNLDRRWYSIIDWEANIHLLGLAWPPKHGKTFQMAYHDANARQRHAKNDHAASDSRDLVDRYYCLFTPGP